VTQQPCLICGRKPSDAHHLRHIRRDREFIARFSAQRAWLHRANDERAWWKAARIDPIRTARRLWKETRVNEGQVPPDAITQEPQAGLF
jgi:hypothetical protein